MKSLRTYVLCACISIGGLSAAAQEKVPVNEPDYNKPKLFGNLPDNIPVNINSIATSLLNSQEGSNVSLVVSPSLTVRGTIVSTARNDANIQSVVVRLSNYNGTTFTLSRITNTETGAISFTGRMLSMQSGDLYELRNSGQQYTLVKKTFYELINE